MLMHPLLLAMVPVVLVTSSVHAEMVLSDSTQAASALLKRGTRELADQLPTDLSICDAYFFGRQSGLPSDQLPFCVHGG